MAHVDDITLQQARDGDRDAQSRLMRALQDDWHRFCLSQLRDVDQAADAAQETALRVLKSLARFDGRSTLKTWTFGIALNVCREIRRREMRRGGMSGIEPGDEPASDARSAFLNGSPADRDDNLERLDEAAALRDVLASLPARQREAVTLRYFQELSVHDAAEAMACAEGTVKATLFAALRNLKQRLERTKKGPNASV
jgi:RNA polymerase sigma-70 factor, ECF subfamily